MNAVDRTKPHAARWAEPTRFDRPAPSPRPPAPLSIKRRFLSPAVFIGGHPIIDRAHFTPCLHGVYIVHTLPVRVLREAVKMSSAFPRPTISAANGYAIIAAFPLKRLRHRMRPADADLVYTSTGQVALTILLEKAAPC